MNQQTEVTTEVKSNKKTRIKAEALGVTVQGIVDTVPECVKYNVLASMVSSISCSIIGTASTMVGRFERMENVDFKSLAPREILHMLTEADMRQDVLRNVRSLMNIRENLRDQLLEVSNDDNIASWPESIQFMTQPASNSRIKKELLFDAFRACGITDEATLEIMYAATLIEETTDRQRSAEQISLRRGSIEWIIENVFQSIEYVNEQGQFEDDTNIANRVEDLPAEMQDRLYDKLSQALNKALTRAAARFAVGDTRYEIGDIMLINQLIADAKKLDSFSD